jgi:hypothetical protein
LTEAQLPELAHKLVAFLKRYPGRSITAADLVDVLEISNDRDLRDVVRHARLVQRKPVISTFNGAYRWPEGPDDDEADHCIKQKRQVAADAFAVAGAIEEGMEREFPREPVQLTLEVA